MRAPVALIALLALAAASLVGCGSSEPSTAVPTPAEARAALADAPAELAALHRQASELLPGGRAAFRARLERLRGRPVVVNVWASWCGPCKREFPIFQRTAVRYGTTVGFLGVDAEDVARDARAWLDRRWIAYPSYVDDDGEITDDLGLLGVPATVFYDADGEIAYLHQGEYKADADLARDIQRYLGAAPSS